MDQFLWRKMPELDSVAVIKPQGQGAEKPKVVLPSLLCRDRTGLGTWLATRKADSDRRCAGKEVAVANQWLANPPKAPVSPRDKAKTGPLAAEVREGLLRAWHGDNTPTQAPNTESSESKNLQPQGDFLRAQVREGLLRAGQGQHDDLVAWEGLAGCVPQHLAQSSEGSQSQVSQPEGDSGLKASVRLGLLRAWAGPCQAGAPHESPVPVLPNGQVRTQLLRTWSNNQTSPSDQETLTDIWVSSSAPAPAQTRHLSLSQDSVAPGCRATQVKEALLRTWEVQPTSNQGRPEPLVAGDQAQEMIEVKGGKSPAEDLKEALLNSWDGKRKPQEGKPSHAQALRESLLNSWDCANDIETPKATPHEGSLKKTLMDSWSSSSMEPNQAAKNVEKTKVEDQMNEKGEEASIVEKMRQSLLNLNQEGAEEQEQEQAWITLEDGASEEDGASIVTLDTLTDISDDYDDFSDMKHELSQWVAKY